MSIMSIMMNKVFLLIVVLLLLFNAETATSVLIDNKIDSPFSTRRRIFSSTSIFKQRTTAASSGSDNNFIQCNVVRKVPYPDPSIPEWSPKPKDQWFCIEQDVNYIMHRLKGDVEAYFGKYVISRNLGLQIHLNSTIQATAPDHHPGFDIDLDSEYSRSSIKIVRGSKRRSQNRRRLNSFARYYSDDGDDRYYDDYHDEDDDNDDDDYSEEYFETEYFHGTYKVLIVRVEDKHGNVVNQSEEKLYNDFFADENNLMSRYRDCSNGALNFIPATGYNVNKGVVTVRLNFNVQGWHYDKVYLRALGIVETMGGINRVDYGVFIMPNSVDFEDAIAFADNPGEITIFKSFAASIPLLQAHEIGHNLNFAHSGKDGVYSNTDEWKNEVADQTCLMGNTATGLNDEGLSMCFNAAKTWYTGWYSDYQITVRPKQMSFTGHLVGIHDIVNVNIRNKKYAVIRISGPYEPDFFVMFQRQKGVNAGIPEDGNKVVITEQEHGDDQSWWLDALGNGDSYVYRNWDGRGNSLVIHVCYIEMGSPDIASIIIYLDGVDYAVCPQGRIPSEVPVPTPSPSDSFTSSPTPSSIKPTPSPITLLTTKPTINPVHSPTISPARPTASPVRSPTASPTTSPSNPVSSPTKPPTSENPYSRFLLMYKEQNKQYKTKSCFWLASRPKKRRQAICRNRKFQLYSEELNKGPATLVCPETCSDVCVREAGYVQFLTSATSTRTCKWLSRQSSETISFVCNRIVKDVASIYGQAQQVCTATCQSCSK